MIWQEPRWSGQVMPEPLFCPDFIGIGAQKCATTWIADVLSGHPGIFVPDCKELDFFSCHYLRGHIWYSRYFETAGECLTGEISPSYLTDPLAPARIHKAAPGTRLILALRDPVERAFSSHLHEVRKGCIDGRATRFEVALEHNPMYIEQSRYARHLRRWLAVFPAESIHIVVQEEIPADPVAEATRLFKFLGVDPLARPDALFERRHENIAYRSTVARLAFRTIGRTGRKLGLGRVIAGLKQAPGLSRLYRSQRIDMREAVAPMEDATRRRLVAELAADMLDLQQLMERSALPWPSWRAIAR